MQNMSGMISGKYVQFLRRCGIFDESKNDLFTRVIDKPEAKALMKTLEGEHNLTYEFVINSRNEDVIKFFEDDGLFGSLWSAVDELTIIKQPDVNITIEEKNALENKITDLRDENAQLIQSYIKNRRFDDLNAFKEIM